MKEHKSDSHKPTEMFGQRLLVAIRSAGYTSVTQFCLDKRYVTTHVYKWIRGDHYPRPEAIKRLAEDLRVRAGWLLFGEGDTADATPLPAEFEAGGSADSSPA